MILPYFKHFKQDFYLAGGTALALQIGHRDSIDFDFFTHTDIDTAKLFLKLKKIFLKSKLKKIQEDKNTLGILIDEKVQCSFFTYPYKLIRKPIDEENLSIASIEDIACMKLSAVTGRASNKDYIDLFFILKVVPLSDLLDLARKKFEDIDLNLIMKSLVYFEDIRDEPILFKKGHQVDFGEVKNSLKSSVRKIKHW